jgi:plasmid stabilization system protein ParE
MEQISWTLEAERWLSDIYEYIANDNPVAAMETLQGIYDRAQVLTDFPECGSRYWTTETSTFLVCFMARWTSASTPYKWRMTNH